MNGRWTRSGAAAVAALAVAALVATAGAQTTPERLATLADDADYSVSVDGKVIAREQFNYGVLGDSLQLFSVYRQPQGRDTLVVSTLMMVSLTDFDLRNYTSEARFRGQSRTRGIGLGDTVFTAYREGWGEGTGYTRVRPPGRLFVLQNDCFTLYDLIGRSLARRTFKTWPLNVFFMGETDTLLSATARDLGTAPLTYQGRTVQARKLSIELGEVAFLTWHGPQGELLRLEQPDHKLKVVRRPPAGAASSSSKPAGSKPAGTPAPVRPPAPKP